jgi:hypothetical protein
MSLFQSTSFKKVRTALLAMLITILTIGGTVVLTTQPAAAATCQTLNLTQGFSLGFAIQPRMSVPVCYTGSKIWVNGGITPGVSGLGFNVGGFDWSGSYNDASQNWLGVGENFSAVIYTGWYTTYCAPRWYINPQGNVYSYSRGC